MPSPVSCREAAQHCQTARHLVYNHGHQVTQESVLYDRRIANWLCEVPDLSLKAGLRAHHLVRVQQLHEQPRVAPAGASRPNTAITPGV
jgi:hypothetical protein